MERVRVEEFGESNVKIVDESILVFSRVSISKFSRQLSTFHGYKGIYSRVCEECERSFFYITGHSGNSVSRMNESRGNCLAKLYFLSCSAPTVVTLQLPAYFTRVAFQRVASSESFARNLQMHTFLNFFILSHTQLLHNSHLNTGYLIVKLQKNLAWSKTNT